MKTEVKKLDAGKKELNIEVSGDIVKNKFEEVFAQIAKEAKVPGFRPGHAPRDMLEKHYAAAVHEQVLKELLPDVYEQAIKKESIDVIELPEISEVKLDREKLTFRATVEVTPEIAVKNYKGIKINYKKITVSPDEIKRSIDSLKESRKVESVDDSFAKGLGFPSLKDLEATLERQILMQKENHEHQRIESEIIEAITKELDFKLPASLVSRQLQEMARQSKLDLALKGVQREQIEQQEATLLKELEPEAKNQVKVYLVLSAIAKLENIAIDDSMPRRVMEFLLKEANWNIA